VSGWRCEASFKQGKHKTLGAIVQNLVFPATWHPLALQIVVSIQIVCGGQGGTTVGFLAPEDGAGMFIRNV
jgi:hypothetical protein